MQVNNTSITNTPNFVAKSNEVLEGPSQIRAQEQRTRVLANEERQAKASQVNNEINEQQRFDVDEQTLALIEQEQLQPFNNNDNQSQNNRSNQYNSEYDATSSRNNTALAAYQSVDTIAQRDNIQQIFGIDLFA